MLKLYDFFRSGAAYRTRIALNLKGLKVNLSFLFVDNPAFGNGVYRRLIGHGNSY